MHAMSACHEWAVHAMSACHEWAVHAMSGPFAWSPFLSWQGQRAKEKVLPLNSARNTLSFHSQSWSLRNPNRSNPSGLERPLRQEQFPSAII